MTGVTRVSDLADNTTPELTDKVLAVIDPSGTPLTRLVELYDLKELINQPPTLRYWAKAVAGVRAGVSNSRVLFIGDSTTIGIDAAGNWTTPNLTDAVTSQLNTAGVTANSNCFMGFSTAGATTGSRLGTDTRISAGSWSSGLTTLGGAILYSSAVGTNFIFTPTINTDTANVIYSTYGGSCTATIQLGSGSTANMAYSQAGALRTATATTTLGANTLKINYASGTGNAYVEGIEVYNSAVKTLNIYNCGWFGSATTNWTGSVDVFSPLACITYLAPALTVLGGGINDWISSVTAATYKANLQTIITRALTVGDCVLLAPAPNTVNTSLQAEYLQARLELARENNIPVLDTSGRWIGYTEANALGYYADGIHPNNIGFADQAALLTKALLSAV